MRISIDIKICDSFDGNPDAIARVFYPPEGNIIFIKRGLSLSELKESIFHEIGHLIDWYITGGNQSKNILTREESASSIGESLDIIYDKFTSPPTPSTQP